jgi:uncharacterized protein (DUF2267 family)
MVAAVRRGAGLRRDSEAEETIRAGVAAVAARLTYAEAHDLTDYLPPKLRPAIIASLAPNAGLRFRPVDDLYDELAARLYIPREEAAKRARVLFEVLREALPAQEVADLRSQLPRSFAGLFPDAHRPAR